MDAKLIVTRGKASHEKFRLKLPTIVGRDPSAGLIVSHPMVSRKHCEIFELNGCLVVRDFGSANGTLIGTTKVNEALLRPGDELTIGPLTFRAEYEPEVELTDTSSLDDLKAGLLEKRRPRAAKKLSAKKPAKKPVPVDDMADTKPIDLGPDAPQAKSPAKVQPTVGDDELEFDLNVSEAAPELPPVAFAPADAADEGTVTAMFDDLAKADADVKIEQSPEANADDFPFNFDSDSESATPATIASTDNDGEFDPLAFLTTPDEPAAAAPESPSDDLPPAADLPPVAAPVEQPQKKPGFYPAGKPATPKPVPIAAAVAPAAADVPEESNETPTAKDAAPTKPKPEKKGFFGGLFGKKSKPGKEAKPAAPAESPDADGEPVPSADGESMFEAVADPEPAVAAKPAAKPPAKKKKAGGPSFDFVEAPAASGGADDVPNFESLAEADKKKDASGDDDLNDFFNQLGIK